MNFVSCILALVFFTLACQGQSGCSGCPSFCDYPPGTYLDWTSPICYVVTGPSDYCTYPMGGCADGEDVGSGCCATCYTPLIIDLNGDGIHLTGPTDGVLMKPRPDLPPVRFSWPQADSHDAWLALDRNANGQIDDLTELFGSYTPQPANSAGRKNGFSALAEFDKTENDGNDDGKISALDGIWHSLLLWEDKNFDGLSSSDEIVPISRVGIRSISLDYRITKASDEHGNLFLYRSRLQLVPGSEIGRIIWDVVLRSIRGES